MPTKPSPPSVNIAIDRLTNSIVIVITGDVFDTEIHPLTQKDKSALKKNWLFNWLVEMKSLDRQVSKLVIKNNPHVIQGLVSISDKEDHIFVNLVENAYFNIGKSKVYEGVGGNLFAFACQRSLEKGYDGVVSFIAKSTLVSHYQKMLGAQQLGSSLRMVIDTPQSKALVQQYFS